MDSSLKWELSNCISRLKTLANELEHAADEVQASIQGMSTRKYTNTLYSCAKKYRKAAQRLERIK